MAGRGGSGELVDLTVLALLSVRPSHPYEMHRFVVDTRKDFVTGLPRGLYHSVDRLARAGLVEAVATSRPGRRPERTVYEITDEGRAELSTRLRALLERPRAEVTTFAAAVSLLDGLSPEEARESLAARAAALAEVTANLEANMRELTTDGLPRLVTLELEYEHAVRTAELTWVRRVVDDLETSLVWSTEERVDLVREFAER